MLVLSCATGEKMSRLSPGKTKAEVVDILGNPDGFKKVGHHEGTVIHTGSLLAGCGIEPITTSF